MNHWIVRDVLLDLVRWDYDVIAAAAAADGF